MSRIRQQYPQNYRSSDTISAEFENVMRYLNAAEHGNKTIGELLGTLFNAAGEFEGPIELTRDPSGDVQYRVGTYPNEDDGWITIASAADLRGADGRDFGQLGGPVLHARYDDTPANGVTEIDYAHDVGDELLVSVGGILLRPGAGHDYTHDPNGGVAGNVTFTTPFDGTQIVSIMKIRAEAISGFTRADFDTTTTQAVFPFVHEPTTELAVYLNGILQREGGAFDYITDAASDVVTFVTPVLAGNTVTVVTVEDITVQAVTGLMTEASYTDPTTGLIQLSKVAIEDGAIPQVKISGLAALLALVARISVGTTTPENPLTGHLWIDTSKTPNQLKFYDGTQFLATTPDSALPAFVTTQAGQALHINGTGTGLEFKGIDFSALVPKTQRGAANGVATLDTNGRLPSAQLPSVLGSDTIYENVDTPINGAQTLKRIFKQKVQITGISIQTGGGTADVQIAINGVGTGSTYAASTVTNSLTLGSPIEVDALSSLVGIGVIVSNVTSAADLEIALAISLVAS